MSKFSDLIQKKHEMLKVTMKVDPAACKNGEITHFQEYVGFMLAEKEFEKTYEKLLKKYTLQNEGFFDAVKGAAKAVVNRVVSDVTSPFKDPKFNPFVGYGEKELPKSEADKIIEEILNNWLCDNTNKKLSFIDESGKTYKSISLSQFPKQTCVQKTAKIDTKSKKQTSNQADQQSISGSTQATPTQATPAQQQQVRQPQQRSRQPQGSPQVATQTRQPRQQQVATATPQPQEETQSYDIASLILFTDFNNQLNINSVKQYFIENGNRIIEERKKESTDYRKSPSKIKIDDVIKNLEYVIKNNLSRQQGSASYKKYTWVYMLAKDGQQLKVTNPKDGA